MPKELVEGEKTNYKGIDSAQPNQNVEEIMRIVQEASRPAEGAKAGGQSVTGTMDLDDDVETDGDVDDVDNSSDFMANV